MTWPAIQPPFERATFLHGINQYDVSSKIYKEIFSFRIVSVRHSNMAGTFRIPNRNCHRQKVHTRSLLHFIFLMNFYWSVATQEFQRRESLLTFMYSVSSLGNSTSSYALHTFFHALNSRIISQFLPYPDRHFCFLYPPDYQWNHVWQDIQLSFQTSNIIFKFSGLLHAHFRTVNWKEALF